MFEKVDENDFSRRRKRLVEDSRVVSKSSSRIPCRSNPAIRRFIVRPLVYIIKETRFQDVTSLSLLTQYQLLMIVYVYVFYNWKKFTRGHSSVFQGGSCFQSFAFTRRYLTELKKKLMYRGFLDQIEKLFVLRFDYQIRAFFPLFLRYKT